MNMKNTLCVLYASAWLVAILSGCGQQPRKSQWAEGTPQDYIEAHEAGKLAEPILKRMADDAARLHQLGYSNITVASYQTVRAQHGRWFTSQSSQRWEDECRSGWSNELAKAHLGGPNSSLVGYLRTNAVVPTNVIIYGDSWLRGSSSDVHHWFTNRPGTKSQSGRRVTPPSE